MQVIPRMRAGGAELGCLQVAEALSKAGHRAFVASQGGRLAERLAEFGAIHITLPLASKNPLRMLANARELVGIIRRENVDIIHARSRAPAWSALWAARKTGIGFVTTYHSEYSETSRIKRFYNSVMARSDTVIAVSDYMAHLIRTRYHTPEERIAVIHRAFDPDRFDLAAMTDERLEAVRSLLQIEAGDRVLLLAGRITPRKAQDHLVEALGILKARGSPKIVAVLAGEIEKPEFRAKLEKDAARLGIADWLRFPGHVADMPAAYMASDISLNISEQEGLPRAAIESQAMGVPMIVSDTGTGTRSRADAARRSAYRSNRASRALCRPAGPRGRDCDNARLARGRAQSDGAERCGPCAQPLHAAATDRQDAPRLRCCVGTPGWIT